MFIPHQPASAVAFAELLAPPAPTEIGLSAPDAAALTHIVAVLGTAANTLIEDSLKRIFQLTPHRRAERLIAAAAVADAAVAPSDSDTVVQVNDVHWRQAAMIGEKVGVTASQLTRGLLLGRIGEIQAADNWAETVAAFDSASFEPPVGMANLEL